MLPANHSTGECYNSTSMSSEQELEDDRMIALVLSEEYEKLDGAVGRRLTYMAPVPHVPKINTYFPNINDASLDHQGCFKGYMSMVFMKYGFSGDGNCQLFKNLEYHKNVRKDVVKQLKDHRRKLCPDEVFNLLQKHGEVG